MSWATSERIESSLIIRYVPVVTVHCSSVYERGEREYSIALNYDRKWISQSWQLVVWRGVYGRTHPNLFSLFDFSKSPLAEAKQSSATNRCSSPTLHHPTFPLKITFAKHNVSRWFHRNRPPMLFTYEKCVRSGWKKKLELLFRARATNFHQSSRNKRP